MRKVVLVAVILAAIVVAIAAGSLILYGLYRYSELESCDRALEGISERGAIVMVYTSPNYSISVCSNITKEESDLGASHTIDVKSCDLHKIKMSLDNPEDMSLEDLQTYIRISDGYSTYRLTSYMKEMVGDKLRQECDLITALSSSFYTSSSSAFIDVLSGTTLRFRSRFIKHENLTKNEKKVCVIDLLNAEKKLVEFYSNSYYESDYEGCVKDIEKYAKELGDEKVLTKKIRERMCHEMIKYRRNIFAKVKADNIDYNQKHKILFVLYLQKSGKFCDLMELDEFDVTNIRRNLVKNMENEKCRAILEDV